MFLKIKEPAYFEQVVKPFLKNKIEKTFVDYWLLDMDDGVFSFEPPHRVKKLNVFEQCLMVEYLLRRGKKQRATEIAEGVRDGALVPDVEIMNRIYDIVLSMNSLNSQDK